MIEVGADGKDTRWKRLLVDRFAVFCRMAQFPLVNRYFIDVLSFGCLVVLWSGAKMFCLSSSTGWEIERLGTTLVRQWGSSSL